MKDMDSLLAQVLAFRPNRLVPPFDLQGHIPFVAWLVKELQPATFVQLGTQSGNLYFAACQTVAENSLPTRCWAVGTWQAEELAQRHSVQQEPGASDYNRQHFGAFSGLLRMGDAQALPRFAPGSIDLLLIDGRYSPETVRNEYESWRDRLSDHAVVLLVGIEQADSGAAVLWQQLQGQYPHLAFAHAQGLGVLAVGRNVPKAFQQALQVCATPEARNQLAGVADMLQGAQVQAGMQAQIEALTARLAEREEQCSQLQRTQAELQQKLDGLQRVEEARLKERLAEANQALEEARAARQASDQHAAELHHLATALQQSLCWRVTAPIRWVGTPINRTRQKVALVRRSIAMRGGVGKTASQAVSILRNEGVQGLQTRISNAERLLNVPAAAAQAALLQPGEDPYHGWLRLYDPTDKATMRA